MNETIWVTTELLTDAGLFAGLAVLLAVLSLAAPPSRRRGLIVLAAIALVMLAGLWTLGEYGRRLGSGTPYDVAREALLGLLAVAVLRSLVLFIAHVVFGRFRVPHILVDALFMLGMIAYAIYRLNAVGVNLAGIVTTSAIVTGALAFSAGETLGNLWAGVSLQLENTLRLGDWVRFGDRVGQVVSIRWRSMAIATSANETFVVPNSALMKDRVVVLGRAGETAALYRHEISFQADYDDPPAKVIQVITDALRRCEIPNVARTPAPFCVCKEFQDSGILYAAIYYPLDIGSILITDSDVLVAIYAALQRENIPIPFPQQVVEIKRRSGAQAANAERSARIAVIDHLELFGGLTQPEREAVADGLRRLPYATNDLVFRKGEEADSLYILARGRVRIMDEDANGRRMALAELSAPNYFGEMGLLTGQPRGATVMANGEVLCYSLNKAAFDAVLKARPEIADSLGHVLARRQAENDATLKALDAETRARRAVGGALEIVRRIRQFFALPGDHS
jgi:small-conductance mechanosensitive channel/CRP-like cAMP-binding protein